ncbi:tryptophan synthase subunit beta [Corynebacterium sp. 320]|uniref:tryptophan synthase subunit beta n=1 Tax=Corynebacterium TaxID=1716 RepID=UPI00125CAD4D|nr:MULTISPECIES: tryptophan synthase subunit beta [Corynebacterium]KAB1504114.1 tryptophan synthase subunit beta [Corynebacterium sp. 320]KAB1552786.1 tryptophan synthase subunit beta [Corynebacterium sp. 321]KAB1553996.1 tryptophan synthase subunit beta [Corynebacterium sp. 319]KAB3528250.1 tryptophan synthase subunit beta [Corynebacterium sp. 250]KAB3540261.1 tryptophan synthase subunit beta [Corynebacterium sp. 366]
MSEARQTLLNAYFGEYGGQYVPEVLLPVLDQLEQAYVDALNDPTFAEELDALRKEYLGRPTPITECSNLPLEGRGRGKARIFLKREDLCHGGAHKGNQVLAQALMAKRLGKTRLIAETGAGQHGTATAMVASLMGMDCTIYMGAKDVARQQPNVFRMRLMGATVVPVTNEHGDAMADAIDVALGDWVENVDNTHYVLGSACGPHPFPTLVHEFQAVISRESRPQMQQIIGGVPDAVVACAGGGSNAIGAFSAYLENDDASVRLIGVEPAGEGLDTDKHGAPLNRGVVGILHGSRSYALLKDEEIMHSHSVSAGLDYPGIGPEHSHLKDTGRAEYPAVTDAEALQAFRILSRYEGIIPALESAHAVAYALKLAEECEKTGEEMNILVNLSGRGDKDVDYVRRIIGDLASKDPYEHPVVSPDVSGVLEQMTAESNEREGV